MIYEKIKIKPLNKETILNNYILQNRMKDVTRVFPETDLNGKSILLVNAAIFNYGILAQNCAISFFDKHNRAIDAPMNIRNRNNFPNKYYTHAVAANKRRLCNYGIPFIFTTEELAKISQMVLTWTPTKQLPVSITEFYTFHFHKVPTEPVFVTIEDNAQPYAFINYIVDDPYLEKFSSCDETEQSLHHWLDEFSAYLVYSPHGESESIPIPTHHNTMEENTIDSQKAISRQMLECIVMLEQENNPQMNAGFIFEKDIFFT